MVGARQPLVGVVPGSRLHPFVGTLLGKIIGVGDSLSAGYNSADSTFDVTVTAPLHSLANANTSVTWVNTAVGGWKINPDMINDAATHVDPAYDGTKPWNIICFWGGTNDLYLAGTPPATLLGNLQTYVAARRAANPGVKIIVSNCIPRNSLNPATVTTWNNLLVANQASVADAAIVDLFTIVGTPGQSDGTHITTAQGVSAASAWETTIRSII
jgi:hypothetical protein